MQNKLFKGLLRLVGVPFLTFLLFVFECSNPSYYLYILIACFFLSLCLWEGSRWIGKFLDQYFPWDKNVTSRILIQLSWILIFTGWVTYFFTKWMFASFFDFPFTFLIFRSYFFSTFIISVLYSAIISGEIFFNRWKSSLIQAEDLKRQNLLIQYETLKNQINPHFLFNSINTLVGLIEEDKELAIEYGEQFAKIYRYVLEHRKDEVVTLQSELDIIQKHAFLLKGRFGGNLAIDIDVNPVDRKKFIPPMTLQMLVENAVKHNVISREMPLYISIAGEGGGWLVVRNNIQRKNSMKESTGIGLQNIRKRYRFIAGKDIFVTEETGEFIVEIPLLDPNDIKK